MTLKKTAEPHAHSCCCYVHSENAKHADLGLEHDSNMVRTCIEHVFEACGQSYLGIYVVSPGYLQEKLIPQIPAGVLYIYNVTYLFL
jgi:hypothetical protein